MTTIPIEVIVQDAEATVVPGEDGTNNTNINTETAASVAVPDTGAISGNGDASSSASSIILPAILLVLAIGSIVAILIHKYHKQKKDKTTRKEKLAVATSSTIAVLAIAVLIGNLVIPATKAATSGITDGIVPAEDKISITVTRDGSSAEASIESTATITSTSDFGYKVLLSTAEGVETSNLYLNGDETSEYYIAPVEVSDDESEEEGTVLAGNTWGYALEEGTIYNAVPLVDNAATVAQGDEPVEDEELSIYYGVRVSSDLPAGTYSGGEIEYSLEEHNGFPVSLTTMQGMTHEICESVYTPNAFKTDGVTIEDNVPTKTLTDIRDGKTYTIAKLADGKCWMVQNLDLQKEGLTVALNSDNTDYPVANFALPESQKDGSTSWDSSTAHVYDITQNAENPYKYCLDYSSPGCDEWGDVIPEAELGNLYNWYTATAGTGTSDIGSGGGNPDEATGSICPKGWRLPNNSNSSMATDYSNLLYQYGITKSATDSSYVSPDKVAIYKAPLSLVPTGYYYYGLNSSVGRTGYLWSSLAIDITSARYFGFYSRSVNPQSGSSKSFGDAVRCVGR